MEQEKVNCSLTLFFFATAYKKPCYVGRAVQAGKPMTADGDPHRRGVLYK